MKGPKLPKVSLIMMIVFTIVGSILCAIKGLPKSVFGMDIATFIDGYLGYIFIIAASFYYAATGK